LIDLNHLFLFLALVSSVAVLIRSWGLHMSGSGWRIASGVVLGVTVIAWLIIRSKSGYIGGAAWFLLLFLPAIGLRRMTELSAHHRYRSARRLATALHWLHPSADLRNEIGTLRYLEMQQSNGVLPPVSVPLSLRSRWQNNRLGQTPAVVILIVANSLAFLIELATGAIDLNDGAMLLRLGALRPSLVLFGHEYWRLIAALFLHAGVVHLLFNLFALYVIGPQLERIAGATRFVICYLVSGICSTAGIVILWRLGISDDVEVVGASGCIMGIVGAMAAFLIRDRHMPMARRRLGNIVFIVIIQTLFDLSTPEVSMSAHLCGLAGGVLIGLIVAPRNSWANGGRRPSF
jgi:membrane associated rhomboid family serine protease